MRRSWRAVDAAEPARCGGHCTRTGMGMVLAFAMWVLAMAFLYALVQGQAQSGALGGVERAAFLRTILFAGESALEEAGFVLRHRPSGRAAFLGGLKTGQFSGVACEPLATRDVFRDAVAGDLVTIGPVQFTVVAQQKDPASDAPWLVDLAVKVQFSIPGGSTTSLGRTIRRRYAAQVRRVIETVGPRKGQVLYAEVSLEQDPIFEVVEP